MYKCKYQFSSFPFIKLFMLFHIKKTSSRLIFVAAAKNKRVQCIIVYHYHRKIMLEVWRNPWSIMTHQDFLVNDDFTNCVLVIIGVAHQRSNL